MSKEAPFVPDWVWPLMLIGIVIGGFWYLWGVIEEGEQEYAKRRLLMCVPYTAEDGQSCGYVLNIPSFEYGHLVCRCPEGHQNP